MAIRLKKLARMLGQSSEEVLGLLQTVGYTRYNSPNDMLPDAAISKVKQAIREGVRPVPVRLPAPKVSVAKAPQTTDAMGALLGGVQRLRDTRYDGVAAKRVKPLLSPPQPVQAVAAPALQPVALVPRDVLQAERSALALERAALAAERSAFAAERAAFANERAAFSVERVALDADRKALDAERVAADVHVATQRAEEAAVALQDALEELGSTCLLNGIRRLTVVGGEAKDLKRLRKGVDDRVEMRFAAGDRGGAEAEADVIRTDAVLLWDVKVLPAGEAIYADSRAVVISLPTGDLMSTVIGMNSALRGH